MVITLRNSTLALWTPRNNGQPDNRQQLEPIQGKPKLQKCD